MGDERRAPLRHTPLRTTWERQDDGRSQAHRPRAREATTTRGRGPAPSTAPILVVGTLRDPTTPYSWAQALTRLFPSARLLIWDGDGHTAYLQPGSACVDAVVDRYLLGGGLPPAGTVCP
ncbi:MULTISPECIES: alpha/beta hydrolase [unclassified Streptomyces]|uniref:alpha/beta hydrolase n=1 Tax=unclassified Streptomyces TaxID=2593676 RepID=UPI000375417B|nr:alpha/beta hydrolase [Streptomyces sp. BoleA5]MYX33614.1 hypothetical protein [Streptomyces sp. SID8377]